MAQTFRIDRFLNKKILEKDKNIKIDQRNANFQTSVLSSDGK